MKIDVDVFWTGRAGRKNIRLETVRPVSIAYENYDFQQTLEKAIPR